jgi:hypothetical protein
MSTTHQEMPVFTRTFDFLTWLLPITNHFPFTYRHTFTHRLLNTACNCSASLELKHEDTKAQSKTGESFVSLCLCGK